MWPADKLYQIKSLMFFANIQLICSVPCWSHKILHVLFQMSKPSPQSFGNRSLQFTKIIYVISGCILFKTIVYYPIRLEIIFFPYKPLLWVDLPFFSHTQRKKKQTLANRCFLTATFKGKVAISSGKDLWTENML